MSFTPAWCRRHKKGIAGVCVVFLLVGLQWHRQKIWPGESGFRHRLHRAVQAEFPEAARNLENRLGIQLFQKTDTPGDPLYQKTESPGDPSSQKTVNQEDPLFQGRVILVHGLDDPGIIWRDLAPALRENRYQVWIMSYPNDQAIQASSRFFFDQIKALVWEGPVPVSIVAHSMGGLVARDMLTCPDLNYTQAAAAGTVPLVRQLILVGTPNQGAPLARFRIVTEIRDQLFHLSVPGTHPAHCLLDGTGAAGADLLPGSRFLTRLNQRPLPTGVEIQIIAGMLFFSRDHDRLKYLLGDGLVSVDATRLDSVPLTLVPGSHFTMIRNLTRSSPRVPPAVPVILSLLESRQ